MNIIKVQIVSGSEVIDCQFGLTQDAITISSNTYGIIIIKFKHLIKINETTYINHHSDRQGIMPIIITCNKQKIELQPLIYRLEQYREEIYQIHSNIKQYQLKLEEKRSLMCNIFIEISKLVNIPLFYKSPDYTDMLSKICFKGVSYNKIEDVHGDLYDPEYLVIQDLKGA